MTAFGRQSNLSHGMGLFGGSVRIRHMIHATVMAPEIFSTTDDVVAGIKRGDPDAIGTILSRYQNRLYRFLLRIVRDPATAEDLFQQTWLRIMERIGQYDARSNFETWMFTVARNLAIDHLRRKQGSSLDETDQFGVTQAERLKHHSQSALEQLLESERAEMMAAAVAKLPVIHREIISLRFEEDMKLDQIAAVVGVPLSTIKSRLSRALESLRRILE
jgi:RNA polymerase sigma-70 factor, ECF subfamily